MDSFNLYLGKWLGVPVVIHWSWWLLLLFFGSADHQQLIILPCLFFMLILHELGHCIAARRLGGEVGVIMLFPFGGVASVRMPATPLKEFIVALAGPFVNVLLVPLFMLMEGWHKVTDTLMLYNYLLLFFNLIPAFPMDGGRVLRASLSWATGNHARATWWAVRIGQAIAVLFGIGGLWLHNPSLVLIGIFVFWAAGKELTQNLRPKNTAKADVDDSFEILTRANEKVGRMSSGE